MSDQQTKSKKVEILIAQPMSGVIQLGEDGIFQQYFHISKDP